ncbi:MAG TPA: ribonucleotide-diphosphate reductase subunit beta [Ktedonobacterales bacterium]|nr:ribonucleotide-diphosphate reductase subunit beta [Ktedonobacterales bacterium]
MSASSDQIGNFTLGQLAETPVEDVLALIDEGETRLPTPQDLYYRWERQQWRAQDIDFTQDKAQWAELVTPETRPMRMGGISAFFVGEASVTDTLAPICLAIPGEAERIFLTTQLADEARHTVFFERFFREVVALPGERLEDMLAEARPFVRSSTAQMLLEVLPEATHRVARDPGNMEALVEAITVYHILVEGAMALAGQRGMLNSYRQMNVLPGFRAGFTAVARDESRHVLFGVAFLRRMAQQDARYGRLVEEVVRRHAPLVWDALGPIPSSIPQILEQGGNPHETQEFAFHSLRKKLRVMGLSTDLPAVA